MATAFCAIAGVIHARRRRYEQHRRWLLRSYVLICSAVALRLISGAAGLVGVPSPEGAYVVAAWSSWLFPLAACEIAERWSVQRPFRRPDAVSSGARNIDRSAVASVRKPSHPGSRAVEVDLPEKD